MLEVKKRSDYYTKRKILFIITREGKDRIKCHFAGIIFDFIRIIFDFILIKLDFILIIFDFILMVSNYLKIYIIVSLSAMLAMDSNPDISKLQIYPKAVFNNGTSQNTIKTIIDTKISCKKGITIRFVRRKNIGKRPKLRRIIGKVKT